MSLVLVGLEGEGESCWNLPGSSSLDRSFHWSIQKTLIIPEHTGGAHIASLLNLTNQFKGADLWASLPCGPGAAWQKMSVYRYGQK